MMDFELSSKAEKQLSKLDEKIRKKILNTLLDFCKDTAGVDVRKLQGEKNKWRIAAEEFRIKFFPVKDKKTIVVYEIVSRKNAYRNR